jgi:hypothetical protein
VTNAANAKQLSGAVRSLKLHFEASINNAADREFPKLSMQGAPIDTLMRHLAALPRFKGKAFFFLLDEYENFEDYQQQVVNTLVKHASEFYTFKIGVRELGWRQRTTLNQNEALTSPADYVRIDIRARLEEHGFAEFAAAVCLDRLKLLTGAADLLTDVKTLLPGMSDEEEAKLLGVEQALQQFDSRLGDLPASDRRELDAMHPLEAFFAHYWADARNMTVAQVLSDRRRDPREWDTRYSNYKHAVLYCLKARKRGIRKYYSGWNVFVQLAAGNIRYLLELVERSLQLHILEGKKLSEPVSAKTQTEAAQGVGQKNLTELEGLSVQGARLTKLLLGIGRVFQLMAEHPVGHTPEVNQLHVVFDDDTPSSVTAEVTQLLQDAVMHLALLRFAGSKLAQGETKDYDYMVHPIFAPFFVFSYRRKRKMTIRAVELRGLMEQPKSAIAAVLTAQNRKADLESMPDQLVLFERFYAGGA